MRKNHLLLQHVERVSWRVLEDYALVARHCSRHLTQKSPSAADDYFKVVEENVYYQAKANQSFRYLLGALAAFAIVAFIEAGLGYFIGFNTYAGPILLASAAGGMGAVASVLQRISSLEISGFAPLWYAVLEGAARVGLGVLFGALFGLASKGNLVLGTFAENLYAVAAFGVLAGISERFVPEIIRKLEAGEAGPAVSSREHQEHATGALPRSADA